MTPDEFPPVLTWRRKLAINTVMFCVLILVMWLSQ